MFNTPYNLTDVQKEIISRIQNNKEKYYFNDKKKSPETRKLVETVIDSCAHFVSD